MSRVDKFLFDVALAADARHEANMKKENTSSDPSNKILGKHVEQFFIDEAIANTEVKNERDSN